MFLKGSSSLGSGALVDFMAKVDPQTKLGGDGRVVCVDETYITRRKKNRGGFQGKRTQVRSKKLTISVETDARKPRKNPGQCFLEPGNPQETVVFFCVLFFFVRVCRLAPVFVCVSLSLSLRLTPPSLWAVWSSTTSTMAERRLVGLSLPWQPTRTVRRLRPCSVRSCFPQPWFGRMATRPTIG